MFDFFFFQIFMVHAYTIYVQFKTKYKPNTKSGFLFFIFLHFIILVFKIISPMPT
jgi:hypothetical protein